MADGDIIGPKDNWNFNNDGAEPLFCSIFGDVFAAIDTNSVSAQTELRTIRIDRTTGLIIKATLDFYGFPAYQESAIAKIASNIVVIQYTVAGFWGLRTVRISNTGMIGPVVATVTGACQGANYVRGNNPQILNSNIWIFSGQEHIPGAGTNGLGVRTITINDDGTMGAVISFRHFIPGYVGNFRYFLTRINTSIFALAISDFPNPGITTIRTFPISAAGIIGPQIAVTNIDNSMAGISGPSELKDVLGNIWAFFYANAAGHLTVRTLIINDDGTFGATIQTSILDGVNLFGGICHSITVTGAHLYTVVYSPDAAAPANTWAVTVTIADSGAIGPITSGPISVFIRNVSVPGNNIYLGNNYYAMVGHDTASRLATFEITTGAPAPPPAPAMTYRNLAYALGRRNI